MQKYLQYLMAEDILKTYSSHFLHIKKSKDSQRQETNVAYFK